MAIRAAVVVGLSVGAFACDDGAEPDVTTIPGPAGQDSSTTSQPGTGATAPPNPDAGGGGAPTSAP